MFQQLVCLSVCECVRMCVCVYSWSAWKSSNSLHFPWIDIHNNTFTQIYVRCMRSLHPSLYIQMGINSYALKFYFNFLISLIHVRYKKLDHKTKFLNWLFASIWCFEDPLSSKIRFKHASWLHKSKQVIARNSNFAF